MTKRRISGLTAATIPDLLKVRVIRVWVSFLWRELCFLFVFDKEVALWGPDPQTTRSSLTTSVSTSCVF
ncbi:hypothetical protein HanXRQr2_Chr01g0014581 [Helianthus annuus]|uniref:Uncharacterized protein n=1 Tax=Helianthus annuus TaxID=4232 RepID=A0A9K3JTG8_HELAN|nr:hypothetical protein HanXRQr2_Chr01g0014581 [Helianthus annuus]KAJ0611154.1 hypothetical protein HanHA300_Chr01g0012001 [Helianthus annuus]KAJ0626432.1 hypothetical protein HanHA89_Chr01g0013111 [Helianthus annuus]KAJ0782770.1 hypothetical protein HanLR1_Chr01g0012021 [Helianthus annuus]KAJ0956383.1 hypothetical protein HanPSC8_Chr01g0014151 [Helianthus annuus]